MQNQYARFKAIQNYHGAVAQLFWAMEQTILQGPGYDDWNDEYLRQCVKDVLHTHTAMIAEHTESE